MSGHYRSTSMTGPSRYPYSPSSKRYHPYIPTNDQHRRCRFSAFSVSPSPPPTILPETIGNAPTHDNIQLDHFSSLPQELIEEIGLLACLGPFVDDPCGPLFVADRHRIRTLHALLLVSKQFNQIFTHPLYLHPFILDIHHAEMTPCINPDPKWSLVSSQRASLYARTFTFWRPRSSAIASSALATTNPFNIIPMLTNIRQLTLAGNLKRKSSYSVTYWGSSTDWTDTALTPQAVPYLTSIRLLDVDDAELVHPLLFGIAHQITSLVIQPASEGVNEAYSPKSVYTTLRDVFENLTALESLSVSLPPLISGINHCSHAHKLIQRTLAVLPQKEKLKHLSLALPLFDCRSMQWADDNDESDENSGDEDDDDDEMELSSRTVDHAWFWMTFQNFLSEFSALEEFSFTGSYVPEDTKRKIQTCLPRTADVSFHKAEKREKPSNEDSSAPSPFQPNVPPEPSSSLVNIPPQNLPPFSPIEPFLFSAQPYPQSNFPTSEGVRTPPIIHDTQITSQYTSSIIQSSEQQQTVTTIYNPPDSMNYILPPISDFTNDPLVRDEWTYLPTVDRWGPSMGQHQEFGIQSEPMIFQQNEEWDWFIKYDDPL